MTTEAKQFKEVTVLLVEDDDVDVMGVERALRKLKILNPIVRAKDGLEALELLRDPHAVRRPYVILLDINMPRMNGLEMLAELRDDPRLTSAVVFVLTTSKSDEDKVAAYKQLIDDGFAIPYGDALKLERERSSKLNAQVTPDVVAKNREDVMARGREQKS